MPNRYVSPVSTRFSRGRSTPSIRAIVSRYSLRLGLTLALLVLRVITNDVHFARALDDLALRATLANGCLDLHHCLRKSRLCRPKGVIIYRSPLFVQTLNFGQ